MQTKYFVFIFSVNRLGWDWRCETEKLYFSVHVCRLFSKWNYHWSIVSNGDKAKGETSDFRKVTSSHEPEKKSKIKFKIVPPPPKPKHQSAPPPPPKRTASPKPHRPKRKVEVDVFRLCWRESWMSLKPPKYLYLKAKDSKSLIQRCSESADDKEHKPPDICIIECKSPHEWNQSWKQVNRHSSVLKQNPFTLACTSAILF